MLKKYGLGQTDFGAGPASGFVTYYLGIRNEKHQSDKKNRDGYLSFAIFFKCFLIKRNNKILFERRDTFNKPIK